MLNLAFCITELNVGGAERAMCELAVRLDKRRFTVIVYSLQARPENEAASCVPMLEAAGITVRFLNMRGARSFPTALFRLRQFLKAQKPDCVLSFLFHANLLARIVARSTKIKHIISGIRVAEKKRWWHLILDRWTSRFVEKYVCVSHSVAEFSQTVAGLPQEKIVVIPNGIDFVPFSTPVEKQNRIIFVGRLTYQKGLDWLLETVSGWLQKLPDWEFWIVGEGEERKNLTLMLPDQVAGRIKFSGWRSDVTEIIATSKILVLPSRWEGMPNVILQAMAAGIPVVATEVEGVLELLGDNATEQTCRFGDSQTLTERILALATDSCLAQQIGHRNRERAEQFFSIDTVVRQYEELFENIGDVPRYQ